MGSRSLHFPNPLFLVLGLLPLALAGHDYGQALRNSFFFYEAQRSGFLPDTQRVNWRSHSGLLDGKANGVDLVGGYYDAGDNVKFGLPMAFTVTMMSWSIIEYGRQMSAAGELHNALEAVKWGTDYFIKAHPQPYVLYGEVGDGDTDHYCWQRPEDMTTSRVAYKIDQNNPGSDLAAETAAAMAAASIVFRRQDPSYSHQLLQHAYQLFEFADKYRGKYDSSITVARNFYQSVSGYKDELLWAAAWLYKASNNAYYLNYLADKGDEFGGTSWAMTEFGWDVKYAGVQVLVAKFLMQGKDGSRASVLGEYQKNAESFMCSCLGKGNRNVQRTPGGLLFHQNWNNLQFVTSASYLLTVYSDYLSSSGRTLKCGYGADVSPSEMLLFAQSQVDYILGDNPRTTSYMVGYGTNYPQQVHHRGSSIVSIKENPAFVSCRGGYATWYSSKNSDPNLLVGAIVGGPDAYDSFADHRDNFEQTEPATYNSAPLIGVLARLHAGHSGYSQLLPAIPYHPKPVARHSPRPTPAPASSSARFWIRQTVTKSWVKGGRHYNKYLVTVTNNSGKTVKNLKISISELYGPLWGLNKHGHSYFLPSWLNSLPSGKSLQFVYIHSAPSAAVVSVSGYRLL
ncbi:hypothetical protein DM860_005351 [Cuscuta australis]|uniref:Endoglucanase n=1 Tax=Cuscuta australis TaxID=267555 RepID=A0A328DZ32_9ASTE|nr:hypothetical protein DM860_005351 [Cuscuta australis]